jgi:UDP-N-acetylmuramate: L-alanyl-gamma-D-glutamyl-meso-diaminopimelate ligase
MSAALRSTGSDRECLPADVELPREQGNRAHGRLSRGEHPGGCGRGGDRQRDEAWQPGSGGRANRKLLYLSLPEVLRNFFLRGRHNLVVTGTHGKTTTTALLAWIMEKAGRKPGYLIGGIPKNFGEGARLNDSKYFVLEGDEYDTAFFDKRSKFVHYLPELVIVNNVEFDHADIFNNLDEIKLSFRRLLNIVPQNGMVVVNGDDPNSVEVAKDCLAQMVEVGFSKNCAQRIRDVSYSSGALDSN